MSAREFIRRANQTSVLDGVRDAPVSVGASAFPTTLGHIIDRTFNVLDCGAQRDNPGFNSATAFKLAVQKVVDAGRGTVKIPKGSFDLGLVGSYDTGSSTLNTHAWQICADNIHIEGEGEGTTYLRALNANSVSGMLYFVKKPLANGVFTMFNGSISGLTIDGRYNLTDGLGDTALAGSGMVNWLIQNIHIIDAGQYGIGFQNGGRKDVRIRDVLIDGTQADGMDVKDNGSVSQGNSIRGMTVRNYGRSNSADLYSPFPLAGVDLLGVGWDINGLDIYANDGGGYVSAGLRLKQGISSTTRGPSPMYSVIDNVKITRAARTSGIEFWGIHNKAPSVAIGDAVTLIGDMQEGIRTEQPYNSIGRVLIQATSASVGIRFAARSDGAEESAFTGAYDCSVGEAIVSGCSTGIVSDQPGIHFSSPLIIGAALAVDDTDNLARNFTGNIRTRNCATIWGATTDRGHVLTPGVSVTMPEFAAPLEDRNEVLNQSFAIWQRGASFSSPASTTQITDCFSTFSNIAGTHTITRENRIDFSMSPGLGRYFLRWALTTVSSGTRVGILQNMYDLSRLFP